MGVRVPALAVATRRHTVDEDRSVGVAVDGHGRPGERGHDQQVDAAEPGLHLAVQPRPDLHGRLHLAARHRRALRHPLPQAGAHPVAQRRLVTGEPVRPDRERQRAPGGVRGLDGLGVLHHHGTGVGQRHRRAPADPLGLGIDAVVAEPLPPADADAGEVPVVAPGRRQAGEVAAETVRVGVVGTRHHVEHQRGVGDRAGDGTDVGEEAEHVGRLVVGDHAERLLHPDDATRRGGHPGAAPAVRAHRDRSHPGGDRGSRAARGPSARQRRVPGVGGAAEQRRFGEGLVPELRRRRLADQDGTGGPQPGHGDGVDRRHVAFEGQRSEGGAHAGRVDEVLHRERDAVERSERLAVRHGVGGSMCLGAPARHRPSRTR